jgi:cell fate (sporulation/competence/biofilm development) regulator YlbF (YheA/YmcA/DUF963 family)
MTPADARAIRAAKALGHALGRSPAFRKFEDAQEAFMKANGLSDRLERYQRRQQEVQAARAWGGVDQAAEQQLDAEWDVLSRSHEVQAYLEAQEELIETCREIVSRISAGIGVDFGRACAAGGCC